MINEVIEVLAVLVIGVVSLKLGIVSLSGFFAALGIGVVVLGFGGWGPFIVILFFHLVSGVLTKFKYDEKLQMGFAEEKGGARGWPNVLANGLLAALATLLEAIFRGPALVGAFLGSAAAGCADTLATEVGLLSKKPPRLITKPSMKVQPGTSGGVTLLGFTAAILASLSISWVALAVSLQPGLGGSLWGINPELILLSSLVGGLFGSTVDSILGATIQGIYECSVCHRVTERREHCGQRAKLLRGSPSIGNSTVNLLSMTMAFAFSLLLSLLII